MGQETRNGELARDQTPLPFCFFDTNCRQQTYQWALRLVGNRDDAEDICQEVCLRCLLGRRKFRQKAKVSTWLYRIRVNTLKDFLRRKHREEEWIEPTVDDEVWEEKLERWTNEETAERVQKDLSLLTEHQQQLLIWKYVEGYTHAEIAQRLGITEQSAWQSLHRAREAFKQAYKGLDKGAITLTKSRKMGKG